MAARRSIRRAASLTTRNQPVERLEGDWHGAILRRPDAQDEPVDVFDPHVVAGPERLTIQAPRAPELSVDGDTVSIDGQSVQAHLDA